MWRKAVSAVALVAISAILLVTTLPTDASETGGGGDDFISTLADGYVISFSNPDNEQITTASTEDELKKYISVTQEGTEVTDFEVEIPNGFLTVGSPSVDILVNSENVGSVQIENVIAEGIESIIVIHDGSPIYTSSTDDAVKETLTVTVKFLSGKETVLNPSQYQIGFTHQSGSQTISASINYLGSIRSGTVQVNVIPLSLDSISATVPEETTLTSSMNQSDLVAAISVIGKFNDGVSRILPYEDPYSGTDFEYVVLGSVISGNLEYNDGRYTADLTVQYDDDPTIQSVLTNVEVTPSTPISMTAIWLGIFDGYRAYETLDPSNLNVVVEYIEDGHSKYKSLSPGEYTIQYSGVEANEVQSFRVPEEGETASITVIPKELESSISSTIDGFKVSVAEISPPRIDDQTIYPYDGKSHLWQIVNFDEIFMELVLPSNVMKVTTGGLTYVSATEAGEYEISVIPKEDDIVWVGGGSDPVVLGSVEITPAEMEIEFSLPEQAEYNEPYNDDISIKVSGLNGVLLSGYQQSFSYYGTNKLNQPIYGSGLPSQAGNWSVTVTIENVANYSSGTATSTINITKVQLSAPNLESVTYNNSLQKPKLSSTDVPYEIYNESGHIDAGTYDVLIKITDFNNYEWIDSDDKYTEVGWTIKKDVNKVSDLSIEGWTFGDPAKQPSATAKYGGDITYTFSFDNGEFVPAGQVIEWSAGSWTVKAESAATDNYTSDSKTFTFDIAKKEVPYPGADLRDFTYSGSPQTYSPSGFNTGYMTMAVSGGEGDSRTNAGTYKVTISLDSNHSWDTESSFDGTLEGGNPTFTWTIEKQKVPYSLSYADRTHPYDGNVWKPVNLPTSQLYGEAYDFTDSKERGIYHFKVDLKDSSNYEWSQAQVSEDEDKQDSISGKTLTVWYQITNAIYDISLDLNIDEWTYGDHPDFKITPLYDSSLVEVTEAIAGGHYRYVYTDVVSGDTTNDLPTNAGHYTVYISVDETSSYASMQSEPVSFEIKKANITVTFPTMGWTYDANEHNILYCDDEDVDKSPVVNHKGNDVVTISYSTDGISWGTYENIKFSSAGSYTIFWKATADNHNDTNSSFILEIIPADITVVIPTENGWVYDGQSHNIFYDEETGDAELPSVTLKGSDEDYTWTFGTSGDSVSSTEIPSYTDAGKHTIYYKLTATNYNEI